MRPLDRQAMALVVGHLVADQLTKELLLGYLLKAGQHGAGDRRLFPSGDRLEPGRELRHAGRRPARCRPGCCRRVAVAVCIGLFIWLRRTDRPLTGWGIGLVIGGAIGNVIDRARWGAVFDFADFHVGQWHWPAFNVADSAIVVGVGLMLIEFLDRRETARALITAMIGGHKIQGQMMRRTILTPGDPASRSAALALGGCSAFENLGGGKKVSPDEFKIVSHSPLTMPPNAELRPPRPGEPRPQEDLAGRPGQGGAVAGAWPAACRRAPRRAPTRRAGRCLGAGAGRQGERRRRRSQHPQPGQPATPASWPTKRQDLHRQPDLLAGQAAAGRRPRSRPRSSSGCASRRRPASPRPAPTPTIERRKRGLLEGIF